MIFIIMIGLWLADVNNVNVPAMIWIIAGTFSGLAVLVATSKTIEARR